MIKLAILTPKNSYKIIKSALTNIECKIDYIFYNNLYELDELYIKNAQNYDAIITSGPIGYEIIKKTIDLVTPLYYFDISKGDLYKYLFEILKSNPKINFSKVYIDFISIEKKQKWFEDTFNKNEEPIFFKIDYSNKNLYKNMQLNYLNLRKENKVDFILTRISNMIPFLEKEKIPFSFLFPSKENIKNTVIDIIKDIKILNFEEKQLIFGRIFSSFDLNVIEKTIRNICKNCIVENTGKELELLLIFEDFKNSNLALLLKNKFPSSVYFGWGRGNNIHEAKYYSNKSYIKNLDSNGEILFLSSAVSTEILSKVTPSEKKQIKIIEKLKSLNISRSNSLKMIELSKNNLKITSSELASLLNISTRTANRILLKLEEHYLVSFSIQKIKRGRPKKIYTFLL